jgi:hypothetical protein
MAAVSKTACASSILAGGITSLLPAEPGSRFLEQVDSALEGQQTRSGIPLHQLQIDGLRGDFPTLRTMYRGTHRCLDIRVYWTQSWSSRTPNCGLYW